ncbi:PAS domain S-box-containing protein [Paenibacillus sp. UNCCL117]|uniref:PAS domain S-box protein n=1 Tax=unclassified Paenibacillus TaxID=185978 RepID=UPI00088BD8BF|nr:MULTISPECIES: PAS domain S-box protein [unclassified Paenibacillus]SDD15410.1 PAS domain S-box-containing protein [Paenibacillus sp. cl123]SFW34447.1 PAS domain S-box-containing protein [Paenibacillus sp. UNCCL117]
MALSQVNILIVDDRPENRLAMVSILQGDRYTAVTASTGEEALRKLLQDDYALILMDIQMPGMNGFETVEIIKSRERSKHIPVIFVTALSQAEAHMLRGYEVGGIDFIFKPFDPKVLQLKVEHFVSMYKYRVELEQQKELTSWRTAELEAANKRLLASSRRLMRAEAMARAIGDTSIDTFFTLSEEGVILAANPASIRMFGYGLDESKGMHVSSLLSDFGHTWGGPLASGRVLSGHVSAAAEVVGIRKDGMSFPADLQLGLAFVEDRPVYVCAVRDSTERKQSFARLELAVDQRTRDLKEANARLQLSYDRINDILESITDAFYALDNEWNIIYLNASAEAQLGVSRDRALGRSLWEFIPKEESVGYEIMKESIRRGEALRREVYSHLIDKWVEVRVYPGSRGVNMYVQDMTERRRMLQKVRNSHEKFYKIFQASPSLMALISLRNYGYLDVNESWRQHTGYALEEMVASPQELQLTTEGGAEIELSSDCSLNRGLSNVKVQYRSRTGEVRTGLLSTETIDTPEEPCLLVVIIDITGRVQLEQEMGRLDRLHLIGEMAAGIAHEIRNPMTTVRGFLQLMGKRRQLPSDAVLEVMIQELDRANDIISEFLALAKNKTTDREACRLNDVIEAIYPLIQAEATLGGKEVQLELSDGPELRLDQKEIRQMILNLALNGLEAMEPGGRLQLITSLGADGEVVLEVADQGHGMDKEVVAKIGTPFFTTKEQGTGLGLAVCFSIAARHQAKISWQTSPKGTTFQIRFGRADDPAPDSGME